MNTIDLIIIGISLAIILIAGLYHGRGINTFQLYAVGNRKMSDFVITISFIATTYGGSILASRLNAYYHKGFYVFIMDLASSMNLYLASRFIVLRMKEFMGHFSIAESLGSIYGPTVRITTGVFGIMMSIALLASQFKVGLTIATTLYPELEHYSHYLTAASAVLVIIYSTFGGVKSVALTDAYQFFLFSICFPILILLSLYAQNPLVGWKKFIAIPQFNIEKVLTWDATLATTLAYFIWHALFIFDPARIQRFYMSSSLHQATSVFNKSAIIRVILSLLFLSVSAALHLGGHDIKPGTNALSYIVNLVYFPGMKGILVAAMIALLMSTADSNLHAASVLFANDIWPIITKQSNKPSLIIVRIASSLIGIVSLFVVLYTTNVTHLLNKTVCFYGPAVTIPLIMSSFGFRPRSATVLLTMGISTAISVYRNYYIKQTVSHQNIFESLIISALILLFIHYFLPKHSNTGWIGIKDCSPLDLQNQETKRWWLRKIQYIQSVFKTSYWSYIFPKQTSTFILLGIYLIIYSSISLLYIQKIYLDFYIYWYIFVMSIGTIITLYPAIHIYNKKRDSLFRAFWPMLLYVVLFVTGITYMKLSHFSPMSCTLFIVNIGIGSLLLPFSIMIAMLSTVLFFHRWIPPNVSFMDCTKCITTETMIGLTILLSCLVYRYTRNKANRKLETISLTRIYDQQYALASLHNQENWNRLDPTYSGKVLQDIADELGAYEENLPIQEYKKKLYVFRKSLLKRAKEEHRSTLDSKSVHKINIEDLILKSYETIRKLDIPIQLLLTNKTKEKYLLSEPAIFERLFTTNFWNLCQGKYAIDHTVYLTISGTFLSYPLSSTYQVNIRDGYEKQLKPPTLSALAFSISTDTDSLNILSTYEVTDEINSNYLPKTINNLYQEESRQIVEAHGGYIKIIETETSLTCLYILPIDGKKVMQFKRYHTDDLSKVVETPTSLNQEKELIRLFVSKTTLTKTKIEGTINFIKKAHGATIRKSGEPYYTHPMEVAKIVLETTNNSDTILAALLHDVIEDTTVTLEQVELLYGFDIAYIVDMVTHYNTHGFRWKLDNSENKIVLNQCKDIRVIQIKLADRLHNLRTISVRNISSQKRIAKNTMEFYIPWARKNNIVLWVPEIENICNQILNAELPTLPLQG